MLELDATNANAYFNRGSTYDTLGAYDKAIADYTRALDLDRQMQLAAAATAAAPTVGSPGSGPGPAQVEARDDTGAGGRARASSVVGKR